MDPKEAKENKYLRRRLVLAINTFLTNEVNNRTKIGQEVYYLKPQIDRNCTTITIHPSYQNGDLVREFVQALNQICLLFEDGSGRKIDIDVYGLPLNLDKSETQLMLSKIKFGGLSDCPIYALEFSNDIPLEDDYLDVINKKVENMVQEVFKDKPVGLASFQYEKNMAVYCNDCRRLTAFEKEKEKIREFFPSAAEQKLTTRYGMNSLAPRKTITHTQIREPMFVLNEVPNQEGLIKIAESLGADTSEIKKELALLKNYKNVRTYIK